MALCWVGKSNRKTETGGVWRVFGKRGPKGEGRVLLCLVNVRCHTFRTSAHLFPLEKIMFQAVWVRRSTLMPSLCLRVGKRVQLLPSGYFRGWMGCWDERYKKFFFQSKNSGVTSRSLCKTL